MIKSTIITRSLFYIDKGVSFLGGRRSEYEGDLRRNGVLGISLPRAVQ